MRTKRALPRIPVAVRTEIRSELARRRRGTCAKPPIRWALPAFTSSSSDRHRQAYHPAPADGRGQDHGNGAGTTRFTGSTPSAPPPARRKPRLSPAASMSGSPTRTWQPPRPSNAPPRRSPCSPSPAAACPASPRSGCSIRPPPTHGFESRHTIVQIVNDDMPFLVNSIANEFNRREIAVHLLAHPVMAVRRDLDGDLLGIAADAERAGAARIDDAYRDRPPGRSGAARRARRGADPRAGRSAAGGRGLAGDAAGLPRRHRRPGARPLAQPRRVRGFPALAGGQPFHLPRPSPLSLRRGCRAARRPALRADAGLGARHPAPRRGAAVRGRAGRRRGDGALRARAAEHS